jgi:hypothetical protein
MTHLAPVEAVPKACRLPAVCPGTVPLPVYPGSAAERESQQHLPSPVLAAQQLGYLVPPVGRLGYLVPAKEAVRVCPEGGE